MAEPSRGEPQLREPRRTRPWASPAGVLVALAGCLLLGLLAAGALRHVQHPERFPLPSRADPAAALPTFNPGVAVFRTWWSWRGLSTGDMRPIVVAARDREARPELPMYRPHELLEHKAAFVYTPFAALLLAPFVDADSELAAVMDRISVVNHLLALAGLAALYFVVFPRGARAAATAVFLVAAFAYYPLAKALELTQAGTWIFVCMAACAFFLRRSADVLAGVSLALGVSIKPHLVVIPLLLAFVPGFPRRVLASCLVGLLVTGSASLAFAGWENARDYLTELLPTLSTSYAYFPNQSFHGLFLRLFTDQDPDIFNLAQPVPWIRALAGLAGAGLLLATLVVLRRAGGVRARDGVLLAFGAFAAAATLASPICWVHHLVVLAVPIAIGVGALLRGEDRPRAAWGLMVGAVTASLYFETGGLGGGAAALLTGLELYGGLVVLAVLWHLCGRAPRSGERAAA